MNDDKMLQKRMNELSLRAYEKGYNTYSDFLNLSEISELKKSDAFSNCELYGGYDNADRCVAGFGYEHGKSDYPIKCIKIAPVRQKFADELNHRDFLGSLMNLGINRSTLGDIVISNNTAYLFCLSNIAQYICENCDRIKHTTVKCEILDSTPEVANKKPEGEELIISSQRVDVVICAVFKLSRNQATQLVNQERVFINSKAAYKESLILKSGDIVSVRGFGKFVFGEKIKETKKGRAVFEIGIYK